MMARGRKTATRAPERSLEEQLRELDENEVPGEPVRIGDFLNQPSAERVAWAAKRAEIVGRLSMRKSKLMRDHPDEGGRYSPSPYLVQHGHKVEVAPQDLRTTKDSAFPKRILTQRRIDRYLHVDKVINSVQHKAGARMWSLWYATGLEPKMCANYSPDIVSGGGSPDGRLVGRIDAVEEYVTTMKKVSRVLVPVLVHVVITNGSAGDWARLKGYSARVSGSIGVAFLCEGLNELANQFGY